MPEMAITTRATAHGGPNGTITRIVLHDEEFNVGPGSAKQIARFFGNASTGTSAHYVVDATTIEHCVPEDTIAYHAPPNFGSIGVEHDGFAHFTAADWAKPDSVATLKRSAALVADICRRRNIPIRFVDAEALRAGARGITTHAEVTKAWQRSTHTDPGAGFPLESYIGWVLHAYQAAVDPLSPLLKLGDYGPKVADVQRALNKLGNKLEVDGHFGQATLAILLVFQRNRTGAPWHLTVTGTVDEQTWAALRAVAHPPKKG